MPRLSRYHSANRLGLLENKNTRRCHQSGSYFSSPDSNFVAVWIVKVRKLALVRIFFRSNRARPNKLVSQFPTRNTTEILAEHFFGASAFLGWMPKKNGPAAVSSW